MKFCRFYLFLKIIRETTLRSDEADNVCFINGILTEMIELRIFSCEKKQNSSGKYNTSIVYRWYNFMNNHYILPTIVKHYEVGMKFNPFFIFH